MLVRTYRLTDKLGVVLLKSSAALGAITLDGVTIVVHLLRQIAGHGLGGIWFIFTIVMSLVRRVLGLIWSLLRRVALVIFAVFRFILGILRRILGVVGGVALGGVNVGMRTSGRARTAAAGTASNTMARRAARAEMDKGLVEDPLRTQNRVLSGLVVVTLVILIGVVLWATNPARNQSTTAFIPSAANSAIFDTTPVATTVAGVAFPSPVPTATEIPSVLQARGSLAYVVRESGQTDIWAVGVGGDRTPLRLTNDPANDRDPAWSPSGRQLAFASQRDGNYDLYIYDLDSDSITRMTYGVEFEAGPRWSPDGQWLVYESYRGDNLDIYVVPVDGSQAPVRVTEHPEPDFSPAWSPDGREIAFVSWRDGNQDVYVFSLDDSAVVNITNTPSRNEDHPDWSPDGEFLAYSAFDEGLEKVFVKQVDELNAVAQVLGLGRTPVWSPDGTSLIFAVDSEDSTHMVAVPFTGSGVTTEVIPVLLGASDPSWTGVPLPSVLVNAGGLGPAITQPLYIEQENETGSDPPYKLADLVGVRTDAAYLSDRVNDSFNALREAVLEQTGVDFLGQLEDAFWPITRPSEPGVDRRSWHMTGRAFGFLRSSIQGFPPPVEIVREDIGVYTYWRVYVRVADEAQVGQLGEPLRHRPWDFLSRSQGDVDAYDQGGRLRSEVPTGYYVDLTQLALDYGWQRVSAGSDWRANINSVNYWLFRKSDGLDWYSAMREIYTEGQMGGFVPTATPAPVTPVTQVPEEQ